MKIFSTHEFLDFKVLGKSAIRNRNRDINGDTVQWLKIKWLRYIKDTPDTIHFRYGYDNEFRQLHMNLGVRGRPSNPPGALVPLFNEPPAITKAKYEDLLPLYSSLTIPSFFNDFYKGLKQDGNVRDALAEPDATEDEEIID